MRKTAVLMVLFTAAAPALADLTSPFSRPGPRDGSRIVTATDPVALGEEVGFRGAGTVYDSLDAGVSGYLAASPALGPLGLDDYSATVASPTITSFQFVGGLTQANGVVWVTFFSTGGSFVDSVGIQLPSAGTFIWTITPSTPVALPTAGLMQITANSTFTGGGTLSTTIPGQWFLSSSDAVIVGANSTTIGDNAPLVQSFSLSVPEPATLALLAGGLICLIRRR